MKLNLSEKRCSLYLNPDLEHARDSSGESELNEVQHSDVDIIGGFVVNIIGKQTVHWSTYKTTWCEFTHASL